MTARVLILVAAVFAFVVPLAVMRWTDPRREERRRARRALRDDRQSARWSWPE